MHKDSNEKPSEKKLRHGEKMYKNLTNNFGLEKLIKSGSNVFKTENGIITREQFVNGNKVYHLTEEQIEELTKEQIENKEIRMKK